MKKIILAIAALAISCAAFAQDREIDLESWDDLNKVELSKGGSRVETDLSFAFPMYFGWTALLDNHYKGEWALSEDIMKFDTRRNFVYGLQLADMNIRYGVLGLSLGLRWTFMDFTFADSRYTIQQPVYATTSNNLLPSLIMTSGYDGRKSKIHASYFGIPARLSLNFGKVTIYGGASAEILVNGYAKYKRPKNRTQIKSAFNEFRATVEGGFSYGNLGVYVQYGLTPLFPADLSDARTLTFGLLLGL